MRRDAPQHQFIENDPGDPTPPPADGDTVALLWLSRSGEDAASLIAAAATDGFPVVGFLREMSIDGIDFTKGNIEVAFPPFDSKHALARVDTAIARANGPKDQNIINHGELVIDQDRYEVTLGGRKIDLTYKEYELLKYLAVRPGRVFSREALLRAVWDYDYFGGTRTVDVHVRRLRSKIDDMKNQFIETVWNVGYRFRSSDDD